MLTLGGLLMRAIEVKIGSRMISSKPLKPPNILIYNQPSSKDVDSLKDTLTTLIQPDEYTIYPLTNEHFHNHPWLPSCCLLCCYVNEDLILSKKSNTVLKRYIDENDGRVLLHGDLIHVDRMLNWMESLDLKKANNSTANIISFRSNNLTQVILFNDNISSSINGMLRTVLSELQVNTKSTSICEASVGSQLPGYLYPSDLNIEDIFDVELANKHILLQPEELTPAKDDSRFIIHTKHKPSVANFDFNLYNFVLATKQYGRAVVYTDLITSTQKFLQQLNIQTIKRNGFLITAKQQSHGKGRTGNHWLSPKGCMMFSMQIKIPLDSNLGRSLPIIQHLIVVAFVKAVRNQPGYEMLDVNIKWPNDIYIKKLYKIGGVIVNTSLWKDSFIVNIGLGVNISNEKPTQCLNQLIDEYNKETGASLRIFTIEEIIAQTVNEIEMFVECMQKEGLAMFLEEYYKYWLHRDVIVTLERHNYQKACVIGIDNFGYLKVKLAESSEIANLQPDGNSFDMMSNMIIIKK